LREELVKDFSEGMKEQEFETIQRKGILPLGAAKSYVYFPTYETHKLKGLYVPK
jgi:hypothetical protein